MAKLTAAQGKQAQQRNLAEMETNRKKIETMAADLESMGFGAEGRMLRRTVQFLGNIADRAKGANTARESFIAKIRTRHESHKAKVTK